MRKAGGIIDLAVGIFGVIAAVVTLFFGGVGVLSRSFGRSGRFRQGAGSYSKGIVVG